MRVPLFYEEHHMFYFTLYNMNNDNEMCYLWTIVPNLAKEGIQVFIEFIPIHPQTISITHDTNTINMTEYVIAITQIVFYEPSILYPTVDEDDDENDPLNEDYTVSSESESDDNNDAKEEQLQTLVNSAIENTVTQWESSQWFSSARYDYIQSRSFLDMGSVCRETGTRADTYVLDIYLRETYRRTYQSNFHPVRHENFWKDAPYKLTFHRPNMNNEQGRK
ncbi:hypothetical protein M9H77_02574 [Catharanthus roseus]|uniref:Uncharacterized protein n=1 Tax=Catharanthus roseus TaxID=4058 RepID=A0ACC0C8Z6_CATRO|nr:hypothetical protein M9H77_02574 [Catharanthus roseus]